jgi:hypothetical protein
MPMIMPKVGSMKTYRIRSELGVQETLQVTAESDTGYHVCIVSEESGARREYQDFLPAHLFDALVKNGVLENFDALQEAS